MTLATFLAWPDGSGLTGTALMGGAAYVHTHLRLGRFHRQRMTQDQQHHQAQMAAITAPETTVNVHVDSDQIGDAVRDQIRRSARSRP